MNISVFNCFKSVGIIYIFMYFFLGFCVSLHLTHYLTFKFSSLLNVLGKGGGGDKNIILQPTRPLKEYYFKRLKVFIFVELTILLFHGDDNREVKVSLYVTGYGEGGLPTSVSRKGKNFFRLSSLKRTLIHVFDF